MGGPQTGAVGANVNKFCRDSAKMVQLDKDTKETAVKRAVAGWHEKQVRELFLARGWLSLVREVLALLVVCAIMRVCTHISICRA